MVLLHGGVLGRLPTTETAMLRETQAVPTSRIQDITRFTAGDGFVARLNPAAAGAAALTYSSYVGGTDSDIAGGCGLGEGGLIVVAGDTFSANPFFTAGPPLPYVLQNSRNQFLLRLDPTVAGGRRDSLLFGVLASTR